MRKPISTVQPSQVSRAEHALIAVCGALALATSVPALTLLWMMWSRNGYYGHAYAIPAVSLWLAFERRRELGAALRAPEPPRLGAAVLFAAASFEVLMVVGDVGFVAGVGFPLLLAATAYAVGGPKLLRPLQLPLGFLLLAVPPPRFLTYELLFRLKLFVTHSAVQLLQLSGQTVASSGNEILVPGGTLFVADACSGLTSIITMLPLAVIIAFFLSHGTWRRLSIVGAVVPVAVLGNLVRVAVTVSMVSSHGIDWAQGVLHESFGLLTYAAGTALLIVLARVLR
ncbi:MAG: exosortase/archaeosortase family protein [Myxococcota bacterium]